MNKTFIKVPLVLALMIFMAASSLSAQDYTPLPIDKNVRYGVLENGLTYYIRHNELPKQRAEFYIAQKVGSILEEDNQRGLAHFLEHMAFNGTKNYPGKSMLNYLESIGVKFGTNVNAYTSLDQTVYNLSNVPVVRDGIIDSCLLVLHDWSCAIALEEKEIDNERGVIHEEWRTSTNATMRMYDQVLPIIYAGNQYANRMPIGTMEVVDNFPYKTLRDYYHKWYRPDQQGIIVVGDIDPDKTEAKIKELFGSIKMPENAAPRTQYPVADNKEAILAIGSDKEATTAQLIIFYKHDDIPQEMKASAAGLIHYYMNSMASSMLNTRLAELTQKANPPFLAAQVYDDQFFISKTKNAFTTIVTSSPENIKKGMTALVLETERVNKYGFTASEYERTKANFMASVESLYAERDKQKNSTYVSEYVDHFTDGGSISGIETEYKIFKKLVPLVKVEQINEYVQNLIGDENIVITLMTPIKEGVTMPTGAELLTLFNDTRSENIEAYVDNVSTQPLISELPKAGTLKKTSKDKVFNATVWTLSNGAKVVVKPTTFKDDQILMTATSKGGSSLVDDSDIINIKNLNSVSSLGGLGNFSATELPKVLAGKSVGLNSSIGSTAETMSASSNVKDIETMLQLVYLGFTAPRKDEVAYQSWKDRYAIALENAEANPMMALSDSINSTLYNNHPRIIRFKKEDVNKIDYDKTMKIYSERFKDASDFIFTFVGNIDIDTLKPLVEKYIASLPATNSKEKYRELNIDMPKGKVKNYFDKPMETAKSTVTVWYSGNCKYSLENDIKMDFLEQAMSSIYIETLREQEGGTYGASVSASISPSKNKYTLMVRFDTNEQQRDKLISIVEGELAKMAENGPAEKDFNKIKEYLLKKHNENMNENTYWLGKIDSYYFYGIDTSTGYADMVNKQSIATIKNFAKKLLTQGNVAEIVMNGKVK